MRKILLFILLLLAVNSFSQNGWVMQYTDNSKRVNDIFFVNSSTGFAACDSGTVLKTTNGGSNWNAYRINTTNSIMVLRFANASTGYAASEFSQSLAGSYGNIYKTINGGINWVQTSAENLIAPNSLSILGTDSLFVSGSSYMKGGSHAALYKSYNGGINFTTCQLLPKEATTVQWTSRNVLWWKVINYAPLRSKLIKSTDLGNTWNNTTINGDTMNAGSPYFINDNTGFVLGNLTIYKTTNSGANWTTNSAPLAYYIQFLNENTGWAVFINNENPKIYKTTNSSLNWSGVTVNTQGYFTNDLNFFFIDENTGWIAGGTFTPRKGAILKTTTGGVTFVNQNSSVVPDNFSLSQNYPNPFNPLTRINYELPIANYVSLKIYDALGNEVETLVNEQQNAGSYSVDFNATSLPSGIYFYKLVSENFSETRKMLLIK